jgi:hypothetical protein
MDVMMVSVGGRFCGVGICVLRWGPLAGVLRVKAGLYGLADVFGDGGNGVAPLPTVLNFLPH